MIDSRKITIIIKVVIAFIFLIIIEIAINLIYTYETENKFFNECQNNIKFIISKLEMVGPGIVSDKVNIDKLQKDIAGILSYYKIENQFHVLIFNKKTKTIIYPIYTNPKQVNSEIEQIVKNRIEGKIETEDFLGYNFYYKSVDLSIIAYKSKYEIFYYRNILLLFTTITFIIFIIILLIIDIRGNRESIKFIKMIIDNFRNAFNLSDNIIELKQIEADRYGNLSEDELVKSYNRMVNKINVIIKRQDSKIKEISKQRGNLRKLAYYYKKFSSDVPKTDGINEHFVERFSNERMPIAVLSLKLVNYFDQINEVYPEVINRELESLYRYVSSIIKNRNGFINYFEGNCFNIVFGLIPEMKMAYNKSYNLALLTAEDIHSWILNRNREKNFTGVLWKEAIGITHGVGISGVVGNNIIVMGKVIDSSKELLQLAEDYGVNCITDSSDIIGEIKFKYRTLDKKSEEGKIWYQEIYEIFLDKKENLDDAIKLYQHGLEMYFEGNYEIATSEFKKVNQLFSPDIPSLIFLERIKSKISQK